MNTDATGDFLPFNPIDTIEEWVLDYDWDFEREGDFELIASVEGRWSPLHFHFQWQNELGAMFFACHSEFQFPEGVDRRDVSELLVLVNDQLWIGHFDIIAETGGAAFRYTLPLRGQQTLNNDLMEDLVATAIMEWDRIHPALDLLCQGGRTAQEAVQLALMETVGEA